MSYKGVIMVSDDEGVNEQVPLKEEKVEDMETIEDPPDWLPDGWIVEYFRAEDGTINQYYTSPISDYTFTSQAEALKYLFSGMDERILESKEHATQMTLQRTHLWLPQGWVMEIRAGGENMEKMYKFYVLQSNGVRLFSKEDVLLYLKESKISMCETNGQCDTSSDDNILAKVELNPSGLPSGWVKELVYRKTKEGSVRRDPYYTDPTSGYTFRTLKSALSYLKSGKISKWAFIQKRSVHDIYSFDKCAELHELLRSRLTINMKHCHKYTGPFLLEKSSRIDHDGDNTYSYEDDDKSTGSDSSYESDEENTNIVKGAGEEATCTKTVNDPKAKPHKESGLIKMEETEDEDAV